FVISWFTDVSKSALKIELRSYLEEPRLKRVRRLQPGRTGGRRERVGHRERPIAVEKIVAIEVDAYRVTVERESSREFEVQLTQVAVAIIAAHCHQVDLFRRRVRRVTAAERGSGGGCRRPRCQDGRGGHCEKSEARVLHATDELVRPAQRQIERQAE